MKALLIIIIIFIFTPAVLAIESTPSADIKSKLEEFKKEIASKAAKLKGEVSRKLNNKAYVGEVKTKSSASLTLASSSGPKLVNINQDTLLPKKKFVEEDFVAALGDVDETQVLTAKKIILLPTPKPLTKIYLWGKIVSKEVRLATLLDRSQKNIALSLPKGANVGSGDFIIATGTKGKNEIFEAEFIYIIPQGGILKPKKVATPSSSKR